MRTTFMAALATGLLALPAAADAQLVLGARVGYGCDGGDIVKGVTMSSWVDHEIPIQVDVSFKVVPGLSVGAFYAYGVGSSASGSALTTARDTRLGVQGMLTLLPGPLAPWVGVGTGWGWFSASGGGVDMSINGWEILTLQGGLDLAALPLVNVGLFASYSTGQYRNGKITIPGTMWASGAIGTGEVATHGLFTIGVRGTFEL